MAAKKYLSLEEAAQFLGVRTDEVIRLRERGELRGFADRGTWKFKSDDVEEAKRRRQPDSSPDVPLMSSESSMELDSLSNPKSDSDVRLVAADDLRTSLTGSSHDMPTVKKGKGSDSDVRLVGAGSGPLKGSDSDVKLIKPQDSDSDVKLSDSDSDVRLAGAPARRSPYDSDSDVRLAAPMGSDSDVRLAKPKPGSDSDVKLVKPGPDSSAIISDSREFDAGDSVLLEADSGLTLEPDSGIQITGDSGIRLSPDSGLRLGGDSGIQLSSPADSGILLEGADSGIRFDDDDSPVFKLADDSGIKVKEGPKSGPKLGKQPSASLTDDEIEITAPLLLAGEDE
jgi:excisionase family DNA binding protein